MELSKRSGRGIANVKYMEVEIRTFFGVGGSEVGRGTGWAQPGKTAGRKSIMCQKRDILE